MLPVAKKHKADEPVATDNKEEKKAEFSEDVLLRLAEIAKEKGPHLHAEKLSKMGNSVMEFAVCLYGYTSMSDGVLFRGVDLLKRYYITAKKANLNPELVLGCFLASWKFESNCDASLDELLSTVEGATADMVKASEMHVLNTTGWRLCSCPTMLELLHLFSLWAAHTDEQRTQSLQILLLTMTKIACFSHSNSLMAASSVFAIRLIDQVRPTIVPRIVTWLPDETERRNLMGIASRFGREYLDASAKRDKTEYEIIVFDEYYEEDYEKDSFALEHPK